MWEVLTGSLHGLNWVMVLVYIRVQACVLILPGLGEQSVPPRVRVAISLAITPLLSAGMTDLTIPQSQVEILRQVVIEMAIGLAGGGLLRLLAWSIDIATSAIAATASLSQIVGVPNAAAPHPLGNLMHLGGIALLMATGLPVLLVHLIADGLSLWPPGGHPQLDRLFEEAIPVIGRSFQLAMLLAAPFTLGGLLFQVLSGLINRVMPSLPVVFIGSPASILLALVAAAFLAPILVEIWAEAIFAFTLPEPG